MSEFHPENPRILQILIQTFNERENLLKFLPQLPQHFTKPHFENPEYNITYDNKLKSDRIKEYKFFHTPQHGFRKGYFLDKKRLNRNIHGILLLDKPIGFSSNAALQKVKRLFQARKAGHTGSLDCLATGLLPICLGEATKLSNFLLEADKQYRTECILGVTTTTADAEGEVIFTRSTAGIDRPQVETVIQRYIGTIQQIPPMYSALKYQGQPLYRLARRGEVIPRAARPVTIYTLKLIDFKDNHLTLEVHCSKGTYIRTLVEDIGNALGCGAYVSALRRTAVGTYHEMIELPTLEQIALQGLSVLDTLLLPLETALTEWPKLTLLSDHVTRLYQGQAITITHALNVGRVALFAEDSHSPDQSNRFIGIGQILEDGRIVPQRLMCY